MGGERKIKPDDERKDLLPPPTTVEELFARFNARFDKLEKDVSELRREVREEGGDPWLDNFIQFLQVTYARYRKSD